MNGIMRNTQVLLTDVTRISVGRVLLMQRQQVFCGGGDDAAAAGDAGAAKVDSVAKLIRWLQSWTQLCC